MKSTTAYYLLILYTLALCKPVLPLLQDKLAHSLWQTEHLSTVHTHQGDHHAAEEMMEAGHDENNDKHPAPGKTFEPVSVHLAHHNLQDTPQVFTAKIKFAVLKSNVPSALLFKRYPPPKS